MKFSNCVSRWTRLASSLIFGLVTLVAFDAPAQVVDLSTSPLFAGATPSANVAVSASFEFPTAGQAYLGIAYSAANTYVGYFDPTKCYVYNSSSLVTTLFPDVNSSVIPVPNNEGDPNGYFSVAPGLTGTAINHVCGASLFNGNIMNWATMSALDEFRYALTGGNRDKETGTGAQSPNNGTIIQRAYLPRCSMTASNANNCEDVNSQPVAVPGVPDYYASPSFFPTLTVNFGVGQTLPSNIYINNCKTFMYLSAVNNGGSGNCTKPATDKGVYNIRVSVCDSAEGPTRTDLCLQYPATGKYKPVGTVQRNADKMRFAIFGYLNDRTLPGYTVPSNCLSGASWDTWNRCRVGGVLRAPMKYVGPLTYDVNGNSSPNCGAELNTDGSGTLVDDPEKNCPGGVAAATFGGKYSGFINYLNRFGTAVQVNPPVGSLAGAGEYKRYDTMGEMYYEAIRYFQYKDTDGVSLLPPTPETYQGAYTSSAAANQVAGYFPVLSGAKWPADPIVQQCAANFIVSISDTDTWDDTYLPGYTGSPSPHYRASSRPMSGGLDAYAWTKKIGTLEAGTSSIIAAGTDVRPLMIFGHPSNGDPALPATLIQDSYTGSALTATYFSAGAAYWANTNEIRPDLPALGNNKIHSIKTISVDTGGQDRLVWDRQLYLMGKYGGFNVPTVSRSDGSQLNPFFATNPANPSGAGIRSNAEWESAPGTGYPANYLRATSPQTLISGLQSAFTSINANSGTAAGGSITSASLNYGAAGTYVSQFSATRWSGTVLNESVSAVGGVITVNSTPIWDAGALLTTRCGSTAPYSTLCTDTLLTAAGNRNIVTTITSPTGVRSATNFAFSNLTTDVNYTAALNVNPVTSLPDGLGQQRVNYLRGYRGDEASLLAFRARDSAFGDIINSAPVYVGAPSTSITDTLYQSFYATNVGRTAAVYVGANDGMLHALNATTGAELFAYVPGLVSAYLSDLTNPSYSHDPYVDAIPTVQEAKVNNAFKTVLVSGAGGGARGVFALDVTDPTAFDPTKVIFEFGESDDFDMGNVTTAPKIVKLQTGTTTSGGITSPTYGYFAAVTSYNSHRPLCKSPGNANLLQVLAGGPGAFFSSIPSCTNNSQGEVYYVSDPKNRGVLFLLSLDRTIGTPWVIGTNYYKYFFPAIAPVNPAMRNGLGPVAALPTGTGDGSTAALYFGDLQGQFWRFNTLGGQSAWTPSLGTVNAPLPIFDATTASGVPQPITARPEIASGPYGSTLVVFGTGAYLGKTDVTAAYVTQSEYALIDANGGTLITRSNLQPRSASVNGTQVTVTGTPFTYSGASSAIKGWYVDFPSSTAAGERMVNKAAVAPGLLTFTSLTLASGVCGSGGGYVYQVNPLSGLPVAGSNIGGYTSTVGIPGPPVIVDLTVAAGQSRPTGETINQRTQTTLVSGTSGGIAGIGSPPATKAPPVGRVSWREITNYNDLPKTP